MLIATDGSDPAIAAGRQALALLGDGHEITLVTVVDVHPEVAVGGSGLLGIDPLAIPVAVGDPDAVAGIEAVGAAEGNDRVERTAAALGVAAGRQVVHGQPGPEICRTAEEGGYDVVVIGSHGTGLVRQLLRGSVSHHVIQHCRCPVLVVPEPPDAGNRRPDA